MSWRSRAKSDDDDAKRSRNGATSRVFRATSKVIDAMSGSIGGMSERFDETSEISAAMTRVAGANGQCGPSIATNGGAKYPWIELPPGRWNHNLMLLKLPKFGQGWPRNSPKD
jgi:hypothetical protein